MTKTKTTTTNTIGTAHEFQLREYRRFVASWIKKGTVWARDSPEIFRFKFGHDWNSDYGFGMSNNEIQKISRRIENAVQEFTTMFVCSNRAEHQVSTVIKWLEQDQIQTPTITIDFVTRGYIWGLFNLFLIESDRFSKNWNQKKDKNTPEKIVVQLSGLSEEERMEVFSKFCSSCGSPDPNCQCWNDE